MGNRHINKIKKEKIEINLKHKSPDIYLDRNKKFSFGKSETALRSCSSFTINEPEYREVEKNKIKIVKHSDFEYKLDKLIGVGFYSQVYTNHSHSYAVKIIKKKAAIKRNFVKKIINEKKILEKLKNNFTINLLDSFQDASCLYLVFPYYEYDLFSLIKQLDKRSKNYEITIKFILAQIYLSLSYLHELDIVYRDLKPENIVVNKSTGYTRLIDFGLATENSQEKSELCGTNEYIPPEAIKGEKYNGSFDFWGFGILAHELFIGFPPFSGKNQKEIFNNILNQELIIDDQCVSNEAKDLILYCLNKDLENRIKPDQIPYHPFFKDIDFKLLSERKLKSPLIEFIEKLKENEREVILKKEKIVLDAEIDQNVFVEFGNYIGQ